GIAYIRSLNVSLPEKEDFLKLELSKGVRTAQGGAQTRQATEDKLRIPSNGTAFQIESIAGTIARNKNGEPEQIVILNTTADISSSELAKAIQIRLLPKREAETTEETDSQSSDSETADQSNTSDDNAIVAVPQLPREVQIEGQGGLLALNGDRKLSIRSRALAGIEFEVARVATTQINHLVSQTQGRFEDPEFRDSHLFNQENISRIAIEQQPIALENKWKSNYSAFDFSEHLRKPADGGSERGLFFLTARGWDPAKKKPITSVNDSRFLLVTDIGVL